MAALAPALVPAPAPAPSRAGLDERLATACDEVFLDTELLPLIPWDEVIPHAPGSDSSSTAPPSPRTWLSHLVWKEPRARLPWPAIAQSVTRQAFVIRPSISDAIVFEVVRAFGATQEQLRTPRRREALRDILQHLLRQPSCTAEVVDRCYELEWEYRLDWASNDQCYGVKSILIVASIAFSGRNYMQTSQHADSAFVASVLLMLRRAGADPNRAFEWFEHDEHVLTSLLETHSCEALLHWLSQESDEMLSTLALRELIHYVEYTKKTSKESSRTAVLMSAFAARKRVLEVAMSALPKHAGDRWRFGTEVLYAVSQWQQRKACRDKGVVPPLSALTSKTEAALHAAFPQLDSSLLPDGWDVREWMHEQIAALPRKLCSSRLCLLLAQGDLEPERKERECQRINWHSRDGADISRSFADADELPVATAAISTPDLQRYLDDFAADLNPYEPCTVTKKHLNKTLIELLMERRRERSDGAVLRLPEAMLDRVTEMIEKDGSRPWGCSWRPYVGLMSYCVARVLESDGREARVLERILRAIRRGRSFNDSEEATDRKLCRLRADNGRAASSCSHPKKWVQEVVVAAVTAETDEHVRAIARMLRACDLEADEAGCDLHYHMLMCASGARLAWWFSEGARECGVDINWQRSQGPEVASLRDAAAECTLRLEKRGGGDPDAAAATTAIRAATAAQENLDEPEQLARYERTKRMAKKYY